MWNARRSMSVAGCRRRGPDDRDATPVLTVVATIVPTVAVITTPTVMMTTISTAVVIAVPTMADTTMPTAVAITMPTVMVTTMSTVMAVTVSTVVVSTMPTVLATPKPTVMVITVSTVVVGTMPAVLATTMLTRMAAAMPNTAAVMVFAALGLPVASKGKADRPTPSDIDVAGRVFGTINRRRCRGMAKAALTRTFVRDIPAMAPGQRKYRVYDNRIPGLAVEISVSGLKTFWQRYTDPRGRRREIRIGRYGDITVDQARKRAHELRAAIALGGDPAGARDRQKAMPTLVAFVTGQFIPHVAATIRSRADYEVICRVHIVPALGRMALDEVTPADVTKLRARLIKSGLSNARVNRVLAVLRRAFNLALKWEVFRGRNPAASPGMLPVQHRERYLTEVELRGLMAALGAEPDRMAGAAIMLLALTGVRRSEILRARWEHVDVERRHLIVPLAKSGRRGRIVLSDAALALIGTLPRVPGQDHVFPSARCPGRPVEGVRTAWARAKLAAGLPADLRLHDLRHNYASLLINSGWTLQEVGQLLGHTQLATTARYAHLRQDRLVEAANVAGRIATGTDAITG
jgi:integrase